MHSGRKVVAALLAAALLGAGDSGSAAANGSEPSVTYVVTFSARAEAESIAAFQRSMEQLIGNGVQATKISPIAYMVRFMGAMTAARKSSIEHAMDESPIVCGYCETGTGCLDVIMKKPGCGGH